MNVPKLPIRCARLHNIIHEIDQNTVRPVVVPKYFVLLIRTVDTSYFYNIKILKNIFDF